MRRTIHLCQRGASPPRCLACGEVAQVGRDFPLPQRQPAVCVNLKDWETIYADHPQYRRCIDNLDARDQAALRRFPTPDRPGYYWAEWRIVEDGSFPDFPSWDDHPAPGLHVVEVWSRIPDGDDKSIDDEELVADVPGCSVYQPLDNFVWRSARIDEPS